MRNRLVGVVLALCASAFLAACGSDDEKSAASASAAAGKPAVEAPQGLVSEGKLTACMDVSFPPMEYFESGSKAPTGFDVATMKAVADAWGVTPVYKNTNFDGLLPALSSGRCDVAWSAMFINEERTKTFPAIPYYETGTVLLVKKGNPEGIASPEDLAGKTLAAQTGTTLLDDAKKLSKKLDGAVKVQGYPKATDLIQQLVVGRADAALTQDTEAGYRDKQNPGQFEVAYSYPDKQKFGIYTTKSNESVRAAITDALKQLEADGTLAKIAEEEGVPASGLALG
jgi:polar amino acid transport system substrate-binding protein